MSLDHKVIISRDNSLLRHARAVRDGKIDELIFVEGLRLCEEALRSDLSIEAVIYSDEIAEKPRARQFLAEVLPSTERTGCVSEKLLGSISYTKTPQGIVVLARKPVTSREVLEVNKSKPALIVVMHRINNPVNVGAILRTAEAAGSTGVIATAKTSNPFSPKALRGAMGSAFRVPIWSGPSYEEAISWCVGHDVRTVAADVGGKVPYTKVDWTESCTIVLGPESDGLSPEELSVTDQTVSVPMQGSVESLNVAVTAGVLLYEAARQRRQTER